MTKDTEQNNTLPDYEALVEKLKAFPEEQFPDVSEKVIASIKHEKKITSMLYHRMLYSGIATTAAALSLCVGLGFYITNASKNSSSVLDCSPTKIEQVIVAESQAKQDLSIYDVVALLEQLEAGTIEPTDDRFVAFATKLVENQQANGFVGGIFEGGEKNYNHSMTTLALVKLYQTSYYPELFTPLDAALGYIRSNQTELGGWGNTNSSSDELGILNVAVLGLAKDLGWSDMSGHLRRGIRCLEDNASIGLSSATTITEKLAIIQARGKELYAQKRS